MEALVQPSLQAGLMVTQLRVGNADLLKPQFLSPAF